MLGIKESALVNKVSESITPWSSNNDNILLLAYPNDSFILKSKNIKNSQVKNSKEKRIIPNISQRITEKVAKKPLIKLK